ncbi:MAG: type II toxin-antitoxin system VapC family toxin [Chloroflexi bacterium]|nr:type II toxin-antitoxin system VapC family toxin [Chloroflexota bacterium]
MTWLLDTNVLSELRKGVRANSGVRAWFADVEEDELFTSVLVLGEIRRGIESIRRRDETAAMALEQWLARLASTFRERVLPVDARVADRWGALNVPDPVPSVDGLLAATAMVHDLVLVTRNTRDVERTGVRVLDPTVV